MNVITHELDCHGKPIKVLPLADMHIGDRTCDHKLIKSTIDAALADENTYVILDGDLMNTAIIGSKSDPYHEQLTPSEQLKRCGELFRPLADTGKILAVLPGNHEERISKTAGVDMTEILSRELGVYDRYSPTSALIFLKFGEPRGRHDRKLVYSLFVYHGAAGGGRRPGGKVNALEDMARIITADVYIMGHTHMPASLRKEHYVCNYTNLSVSRKEQLFVNAAAFLDWSGSYGDRMGYTPNSKITPEITLSHDRVLARATI